MLRALLSLVLLLALYFPAFAQDFPVPGRSIRLIVPYPAGSAPDVIARIAAGPMRDFLNTPVVVENRSGAQGIIGLQEVARSAPNGHTIGLATHSHTGILPATDTLPFNAQQDFTPLGRIVLTRVVMVIRGDLPARDLREFVDYAKANRGRIFAGTGSAANQLQVAALMRMAGFESTDVPYRGTNSMLPDLISGRLTLAFTDYQSATPFLQTGELRALGVNSPNRVSVDPSIPAIAEFYPGYDQMGWIGLLGPARMPEPIVTRLNRAVGAALANADIRRRLTDMFLEPTSPDMTAADFARYLETDNARWAREVEAAGIGRSN